MSGSVIVKKGNGKGLQRAASSGKTSQLDGKNKIILVVSERDYVFVTNIPLGPSDLQTTEKNNKCKCLIQQ